MSKRPPKKKTTSKQQAINVESEFLKTFKSLTYRHRGWDIWNDFIVMAACALSNPVDKSHYEEREARYLRIIKKYSKAEQNKFPTLFAYTVMALEFNPEQDFLGRLYTRLGLQDEGRKQHFTPYNVCQLMAEITMGDVVKQVRENGYVTLNDPCCGAGATLIAGVNCAKRNLPTVFARRGGLHQSWQHHHRPHESGGHFGELLVYSYVFFGCVGHAKSCPADG